MRAFTPASKNALQIDVDSAEDLKIFYSSLPWLSCIAHEHGFPIREMHYRQSRSRGHWHITILFSRPLPLMERIALQAICGSDRARELCNWERAKCRSAHPILFVERLQNERHTSKIVSTRKRNSRKR